MLTIHKKRSPDSRIEFHPFSKHIEVNCHNLDGPEGYIELDEDEVRALRDALTTWLGNYPPATPTQIRGTLTR